MSEKKANEVNFISKDDMIEKAGYRITTIRKIMGGEEIELPNGLNYLFILDLKIAAYPEVLDRAKKVISRDAHNFHHPRKGRKPNFFSYLYDKEGSILRRIVAERGAVDIPTVIKHCVITTMQCDKQVSLSVDIKIDGKTLIT